MSTVSSDGDARRQQCSVPAHRSGQHFGASIVAQPTRPTRARVRTPWPSVQTRSSAPRCTTGMSRPVRSSFPSPAGRCRCSTPGSRTSTSTVRSARGDLRRLAHGRDRDHAARTPRRSCSASSPTTSRKIAEHGAQYSVLCKEDGGVLDDLFTYRLDERLPDGHQRVQPREGPGVVPQAGRGLRRDAPRPPARLRDARRPGTARRAAIVAGLTDGELPKRFRTARLTVAGAPDVLVCGTGYTGEDGVELLVAPRARAAASGTRSSRPAPSPRAWARATRCAWRSASTSTATT